MVMATAKLLFLKTGSDLRDTFCWARYSQFIPDVAWLERILLSYGGSPMEAILE
jgi:hypothetical protein